MLRSVALVFVVLVNSLLTFAGSLYVPVFPPMETRFGLRLRSTFQIAPSVVFPRLYVRVCSCRYGVRLNLLRISYLRIPPHIDPTGRLGRSALRRLCVLPNMIPKGAAKGNQVGHEPVMAVLKLSFGSGSSLHDLTPNAHPLCVRYRGRALACLYRLLHLLDIHNPNGSIICKT
ncbi:hypothetical protein BJ138DRAFT_575383 [Hygrophoropsis aurantiaca]|uniref:Uncharacterized protein n=1 Tax=Hygrophoropsis aurantiaca TaxID=72124 RepID=A0ACB8A0D6_9AGAM|nr:hypothetical protein BJ138DRAFT_575383 [Hygrophoropsis aurantiaca]